ncbi:reticulon-4-interacting protein 1, mitochondrial [Plutella xylostella]|uniref:reticulon-4-interacting protein 1, mitochondrial n=1 Tax=Plutella xylostella TaxID=51655 RepID=UPI0020322ABE|nr:reticulon-4-interacting protein 1, mitochondrial [Plutella xylostella]
MDDLKFKAGEKLEALQVAAKTAADNGKTKAEDIYQHTYETIRKIREAFNEIWHHELIVESRRRVANFTAETVQRIREGAPPLSPALLYNELVTLFKDRVWRRSMVIFMCGVACGCASGMAVGLRVGARAPQGPHARQLHSHTDQSVIMVDDAVASAASTGEVLIRVQAFSVCPLDRGVLRGHAGALRGLLTRGHVTVGRGFAGVVLDVGHGVSELELGDEVWGCVSEWAGGAASELLTVRSTRVSKRPRGLAADSAASLPWCGALALTAIDRLKYGPDNCKAKRIAICGAASGEGCLLIQLLSAWGAHVTVTAPRHATMSLRDMGSQDYLDLDGSVTPSWLSVEQFALNKGPWDALLLCGGLACPPKTPGSHAAVLKATAPRNNIVELRPKALLSDRLAAPFTLAFAASFYTYRVMRWLVGLGSHTDWLENQYHLRDGLATLAQLVDNGQLTPVLDKVFLPQDFESALAHACSEDAIGTTVIRFP